DDCIISSPSDFVERADELFIRHEFVVSNLPDNVRGFVVRSSCCQSVCAQVPKRTPVASNPLEFTIDFLSEFVENEPEISILFSRPALVDSVDKVLGIGIYDRSVAATQEF